MTKYSREMFVRDNFKGYISDEWDIVSPSTIFKDEYKNDESEKEVVLSYANALNCVTDSLLKQNHSGGAILMVRINSLAIPFIFLARHTVELALKYICRLLNIEYQSRHGLKILWDKIVAKLYEFDSKHDGKLEDIGIFISVLEELDCDGSHSRYSKDKNGNLYNNKPKFINVKNINNFIQDRFIKLVSSIKVVKNK